MKKILTYIFLLYAPLLLSQDAYFIMTGHRQEVVGLDTFHLADVQAHSNQGFKLGSGQLYFNYNDLAFGTSIFNNGALSIDIPANSVLNKKVIAPPFEFDIYGDFITNDNAPSRVSFSWQHDFSHACLDTFNIDYYSDVLFTVRLKYLPNMSHLFHGLCLESSPNFVHQTFTACGPDPCNTSDCLNFPGIQITNDTMPCNDCLIVYRGDDSGAGTLRDAVLCANAGDTIRFAQVLEHDSIDLVSEIVLDKVIYIIAKNQSGIAVDGNAANTIFHVHNGKQVLLEGLTLQTNVTMQNPNAINNEGQLTLKNLIIERNSPSDSTFINMGELIIEGDVVVRN